MRTSVITGVFGGGIPLCFCFMGGMSALTLNPFMAILGKKAGACKNNLQLAGGF
jgi:hypothetical protein